MSLPVTNGANGVTLGGTLTATDEPTFSYDKGVSYTGKAETVGYEEQVASASQIFEWKNIVCCVRPCSDRLYTVIFL